MTRAVGLLDMEIQEGAQTEADLEALAAMQATGPADKRTAADSNWLANGARVVLEGFSMADMNGQFAEVIGFDDSTMRYRVKLESTGKKCLAVREKLRLSPETAASLAIVPVQSAGVLASVARDPADFEPVYCEIPTEPMVNMQLDAVQGNLARLSAACARRQQDDTVEEDLSKLYHTLVLSSDAAEDVLNAFKQSSPMATPDIEAPERSSLDERLEEILRLVIEAQEKYESCRRWAERLTDEWWILQHERSRHGILGMLKNDLGHTTETIRKGTTAIRDHGPPLLRNASASVTTSMDAARQEMRTVRQAASRNLGEWCAVGPMGRTQELLANLKALLQMFLWGFVWCFIIPYSYFSSPLVAYVGVVWMMMWLCFPPAFSKQSRTRMAMLILYPFLCIGLQVIIQSCGNILSNGSLLESIGSLLERTRRVVAAMVAHLKPAVAAMMAHLKPAVAAMMLASNQ